MVDIRSSEFVRLTTGGGGGCLGPEAVASSRTARVLESRLDRFLASMTLNEGRVSAQLSRDISIWHDILYGVHMK